MQHFLPSVLIVLCQGFPNEYDCFVVTESILRSALNLRLQSVSPALQQKILQFLLHTQFSFLPLSTTIFPVKKQFYHGHQKPLSVNNQGVKITAERQLRKKKSIYLLFLLGITCN